MLSEDQLERQLRFLAETEKLKGVLRRTRPMHAERQENSAEHSWTLCLMALLLAEHAEAPVDLLRVFKMLLLHDLGEIEAGDTFLYDRASMAPNSESAEAHAAARLFKLLPKEQAAEFRALWQEFEERKTPEAKFATALDRLIPILQNFHHGENNSWRLHGVVHGQVLARNQEIMNSSSVLWEHARRLIDQVEQNGWFAPKDNLNGS